MRGCLTNHLQKAVKYVHAVLGRQHIGPTTNLHANTFSQQCWQAVLLPINIKQKQAKLWIQVCGVIYILGFIQPGGNKCAIVHNQGEARLEYSDEFIQITMLFKYTSPLVN